MQAKRLIDAERKQRRYLSLDAKSKERERAKKRDAYRNKPTAEKRNLSARYSAAGVAAYRAKSEHEKTQYARKQMSSAARREAEETTTSRKQRRNKRAIQKRHLRRQQQKQALLTACDARDEQNTIRNSGILWKNFWDEIRYSCSFYCVSCRLAKFREQVTCFPWNGYNEKTVVKTIEENGNEVEKTLQFYIDTSVSIFDQHYICHTCKRSLTAKPKPRVPRLNFNNELNFEKTPLQLETLNTLEEHLVAKRLIFIKVIYFHD